ncbi:hypothetical protein HZS38_09640 [Xenorhabdus nematophila]|uniref:hypothetical protein n=1 Tax=Xenorhabdus nematophila TaxID=628 RepID=UPI0005441382|nr:hypothetical protein [Xenorhabdus nematophila]CEF32684.1 conserved hypothetical protein [Xenorhabdus nematophila str. Websteri]AYA40646.1 hypothetical protein D3790_09560 [Xenorhabdus nematophila]KHD29288.1 hypothetical protein LH67_04370 [Xenorhabdus nematophila]MBA0019386.1 hypothetical protein [Xenorhabdus nematophila]MCB4424221.1 hypothetical protein [Xenorhabdus nematophila]
MINNSFHLTQIIASVWGYPSDITEAVWQAGYRKPERGVEEIVQLTIEIMEGIPDESPYNSRPKDLNDILFGELNNIVFEATWSDKVTPAGVAKVILKNGYQKGGE